MSSSARGIRAGPRQLLFSLAVVVLLQGVARTAEAAEGVVINELMYINAKQTGIKDDRGRTSDWIELKNLGASSVSLKGWRMGTHANISRNSWSFPDSLILPAGGFLVVFASGDDTFDAARQSIHTNFKLSGDGEQVYLINDKGNVVSKAGGNLLPKVPSQQSGVSFGIPRGREADGFVTFLDDPTPGGENSRAASLGPLILGGTKNPKARPRTGSPLPVYLTVVPNLDPVNQAKLVYCFEYEAEQTVPMIQSPPEPGQKDGPNVMNFTATIPTEGQAAGSMVRWYMEVTDKVGRVTRFPPFAQKEAPQYHGTVMEDDLKSPLPVFYWFTESPDGAMANESAPGSVYFKGKFYDNVRSKRRGVTSRGWDKPKLKFEMLGQDFEYDDKEPHVEEFNLQSFFYEMGENSYMKEVVALTVMKQQGVIAPRSFHILVQQNNEYLGLYAFLENVDTEFLERNDLDPEGPLFKSEAGDYNGLRWDTPLDQFQYFWDKENRKTINDDWLLLKELTVGLAGGAALPRTRYVVERLNLPQIINEAAVQTLMNNLDRCTKNFFMYLNPETDEWYRLPWDMESSLAQDNGLGGIHGELYCVLHCEQWNSPLYCDSEHPQDVPLGPIEAPLGPLVAANGKTGRRLRALQLPAIPDYVPPTSPPQTPNMTFPTPRGWDDPDRNMVAAPGPEGWQGSYNHLTDALLDFNVTRAMYLRRLRTLADIYYGQGQMQKMVDDLYVKIRDYAKKDQQKWGSGDIDRGYVQITTEFIPMRTEQLLTIYAPGGAYPLLPAAQPDTVAVVVGKVEISESKPTESYVELINKEPFAVDLNGWTMKLGEVTKEIPAGTVLPPSGRIFLVSDVRGFRSGAVSPRGGEGHIAVDVGKKFTRKLRSGIAADVILVNSRGQEVHKTATTMQGLVPARPVSGASSLHIPLLQLGPALLLCVWGVFL